MAIIDVFYEWKKAQTTIGKGRMSGVEAWTVKFDDADDPRRRQFLATTASGIPAMYTSHPYQPYQWYYVVGLSSRPLGPFLFEVTAQYEGLTLPSGGAPIDPVAVPPVWSWPTVVNEEQVDRDINGDPITNSAGESFDPPMTKKFYDHVARVVFYQGSFDALLASDYKGAINSNIWQGMPAFSVKCTEYSGEQMQTPGGGVRYRINMEFRSRRWGWLKRARDEGFRDITNLDDDGKPEQFRDKNDVVLSEPTALNGFGGKLAQNADPVWRLFDVDEKREFNDVFGI